MNAAHVARKGAGCWRYGLGPHAFVSGTSGGLRILVHDPGPSFPSPTYVHHRALSVQASARDAFQIGSDVDRREPPGPKRIENGPIKTGDDVSPAIGR